MLKSHANANQLVLNWIDPKSLAAPVTSDGRYTVGTWWVTKELSAFELLSDPLATIREDDERLRQVCIKEGVPEVLVAASPALTALGVTSERVYPEHLLAEFYPENP